MPVDEANKSFFSEIISSVSDVKFSHDGRYIMARDYLTVKVGEALRYAAGLMRVSSWVCMLICPSGAWMVRPRKHMVSHWACAAVGHTQRAPASPRVQRPRLPQAQALRPLRERQHFRQV